MDAQLIGLLAVGATLIGAILIGLRGIRQDMDKRFDAFGTKLEARFDAIDQKFDAAEQLTKTRFDAIDQKFEARFNAIDQKFDAIDLQFVEINGRLSALENGQADMRERMARLEGILEGLAFRTQVMPVSAGTGEEA